MAELTNLESKLGEVVGLAMAAQEAGQKVAGSRRRRATTSSSAPSSGCVRKPRKPRSAGPRSPSSFEGKKTAILDEAREVKGKAQEMMKTYLDQASDTLDGFEFLTMAEAGEVGHWEILDTLNKRAANRDVSELVGWALPDPAAAPRDSAIENHSSSPPEENPDEVAE